MKTKEEKGNPKVDAYLSKANKWREEMERLRVILLDCHLSEEWKWGKPCYTFQQSNVVIIMPLKKCCALLFAKGALLKDTTVSSSNRRRIRRRRARFGLPAYVKSWRWNPS